MPFGFDTRVVAQARATQSSGATNFWELTRLIRRVGYAAVVLITCASAAAYWQLQENDDADEPLENAYAIADNAIEAEVF